MSAQPNPTASLGVAIPELGVLASRSRTWGALSIAFGALGLVAATTITAFGKRGATELTTAFAVGAFAVVGLLAGASYLRAGRELRSLGRASHDPIESTVAGLAQLGKAFRAEAIVTGMSIALAFAAGLVLNALRNV